MTSNTALTILNNGLVKCGVPCAKFSLRDVGYRRNDKPGRIATFQSEAIKLIPPHESVVVFGTKQQVRQRCAEKLLSVLSLDDICIPNGAASCPWPDPAVTIANTVDEVNTWVDRTDLTNVDDHIACDFEWGPFDNKYNPPGKCLHSTRLVHFVLFSISYLRVHSKYH